MTREYGQRIEVSAWTAGDPEPFTAEAIGRFSADLLERIPPGYLPASGVRHEIEYDVPPGQATLLLSVDLEPRERVEVATASPGELR